MHTQHWFKLVVAAPLVFLAQHRASFCQSICVLHVSFLLNSNAVIGSDTVNPWHGLQHMTWICAALVVSKARGSCYVI